MKKITLLTLAALMLVGTAFAKEDNGALAGGVVLEQQLGTAPGLKFSGLFDIGWNLVGPIFYGLEIQGTYKQLSSDSASDTSTMITTYYIDDSHFIGWVSSYSTTSTLTVYETDLSPRVYASIDLGDNIQALGFLGVSKNVNAYDYVTVADTAFTDPDTGTYYSVGDEVDGSIHGQSISESPWSVVAGIRGSMGMFYVDYTRYLVITPQGGLDWNAFTADKFGAGVTLRW